LQAPGGRSHEVVVLGGGIVGLACAWRIAQSGLRVVVLERDEPGGGASGVAAGMLAPVTEAEFGEEALLRLNLEGAAVWPAFAAELAERTGIDLEFRASGALAAAADRDDVGELRRLYELRKGLGLETEWLTGRECRRLEPGLSPRVSGGMLASGDGHVDPRAVTAALCEAIRREGGEIRSGVEVDAIEESGGAVTGVRTGGELLSARTVVAAAGAWTARLGAGAPPVRPVKGQILRLRGTAGDQLAARIIRTPRCYVVQRPGGEIVVGATVEEHGFDVTVTAGAVHRLLEAAWEVLPDTEERELVEARAGLRPGTPDNRPIVGPAPMPGLVWATGHYRNGVLLAPITGAAVARIAVGDDPPPEFAPFSPARLERGERLAGSPA